MGSESQAGRAMYDLSRRLYPICRSITGDGVRQTLAIISETLPDLRIERVPSGTAVNDWVVPDEWNVRDAYVADTDGNRVIDFRAHNLHLLNYSVPLDREVDREELLGHIHTLPDQPDLIPYRTSYYSRDWGFCLEHRRLKDLTDDTYRVRIDTTLEPGFLDYGELVLQGHSDKEFVFSTHICHPSLANDNLSGISLVVELARTLVQRLDRHYTYRFLFVPGTIGAITWLAQNGNIVPRIEGVFVAALVGAPGPIHVKQSRQGNSRVDRVARQALEKMAIDFEARPFTPYGYDERQYSSPGYAIPSVSITRTPYGEFPEYHTSADNLEFIRPDTLAESLRVYQGIVDVLEGARVFVNLKPYAEPQLGRRGLYTDIGGAGADERRMAMFWILNLADGHHSLDDIAERSGIALEVLQPVAELLVEAALLAEI